METLERTIKDFCFQAPRWMQIEIQGFWYGLMSWSLTCLEDKEEPNIHTITVKELLEHSDTNFKDWPTDWLESSIKDFIDMKLSYEEQETFFTNLEQYFKDSIPVDLNIYTILMNGDTISEEQWERLYDSMAFLHPQEYKSQNKTRRIYGKRSITPMRRRKAFTYHKKLIIKKEI
jgi:hypothetical protein